MRRQKAKDTCPAGAGLVASRCFRTPACDSGVLNGASSGWSRVPGHTKRLNVYFLFYDAGRRDGKQKPASAGAMVVSGVKTSEKPVFCLDSGQWLTGRVEWLIPSEAGDWRFPPKFGSRFQIGLLIADIAAFIGFLKILLYVADRLSFVPDRRGYGGFSLRGNAGLGGYCSGWMPLTRPFMVAFELGRWLLSRQARLIGAGRPWGHEPIRVMGCPPPP